MQRRTVGVIGSGISGISAAYHIAKNSKVNVTILEANEMIGGHELPVCTEYGLVDLGFMVLNRVTYPNLLKFYEDLNIPVDATDMSFSVCDPDTDFQSFAFGSTMQTLRFLKGKNSFVFMKEKRRFHDEANQYLEEGVLDGMTVLEWFESRGYHECFIYGWIIPFCSAVWSSPLDGASELEAFTILQFLRNHGFLNWGTIQWYTPRGRTAVTLERMEKWFDKHGVNVLTNSRVDSIKRDENGVVVLVNGEKFYFDDIVIAADAGVAHDIIEDKSPSEELILSGFRTYSNNVILHTDPSQMPVDKNNWTAWNISKDDDKYVCTYWVKKIQHVEEENLFITLNPSQSWIDQNQHHIIHQQKMSHPLLDSEAIRSQRQLDSIQGSNNIYYAGAYLKYGFHEDGFVSGIEVSRKLLQNTSIPLDPIHIGDVSPFRKILTGYTTHTRYRPINRSFTYDLCMDYVDLDTANSLGGYKRTDHFGDVQKTLSESVRLLVQEQYDDWVTGPIDILTHLRSYGHCFNPISFYFCWDSIERKNVKYVVTEVSNTPWNQVKCHVLPVESITQKKLQTWVDKDIHVSPFSPSPDGFHRWKYDIRLPTKENFRISAKITLQDENNENVLLANLNLDEPKSTPLSYYLPRTLIIWLKIHWQAFICYKLGLKFYPNTTAPDNFDLIWLPVKFFMWLMTIILIYCVFF